MSDYEWQKQLQILTQPRQPQHDLWTGIATAIATQDQPQRRASQRRGAWAAAALVLVGFGTLFLPWQHMPQSNEHTNIPVVSTATPLPTASEHMSSGFTRTALDRVSPNQSHLIAATHELDSATSELQQAIEMHPDAVFLVGLLNRTYAHRMRLIRFSATTG